MAPWLTYFKLHTQGAIILAVYLEIWINQSKIVVRLYKIGLTYILVKGFFIYLTSIVVTK